MLTLGKQESTRTNWEDKAKTKQKQWTNNGKTMAKQ